MLRVREDYARRWGETLLFYILTIIFRSFISVLQPQYTWAAFLVTTVQVGKIAETERR